MVYNLSHTAQAGASVYQIQIKLFIIVMNTTTLATVVALSLLPVYGCAVQMVHGA